MNEPNSPVDESESESVLLGEVQLILAEKRTSLSALRTGIAIFVFPLSVLSVLITTSRLYDAAAVIHWLVPLLIINGGLVALATYLVGTSVRRLRHYNRMLDEFKKRHTRLARLLD